ncbi:MAG: xanthine dehydrogenase family protein [Candidatus Eremiobacteraeota bacterium]|nr:xanthine dehydrogenase family protein [Candidatus Eremiobacteraeota bacterium]MBV8354803.1 xanthine dehydrogenase family protein [Candidatus Eremiobacteraeota bacterium]
MSHVAATTPPPGALRAGLLEIDEQRVDGRAKVSGDAAYSADFAMPSMLWAAFAISPHPHARIVSIDTRAAAAVPGVAGILTGRDIGERFLGRRLFDWPVLAFDRVRFIGEYVAAVAAESREVAEEAAAAIEVEYEALPPIFEADEALEKDALRVHEHPEKYHYLGPQRPPVFHPNVQGHHVMVKGDVEAAFAAADRIFEHTFTTPRYHAGYLETRATMVWIDAAEIVHVISTNKTPFMLREQMSICTGLPQESIVIEPSYIGGDFGGKGLSIDEFVCYYLARATRRPIKCVRSYLSDIQSTTTRHASRITIKSGLSNEGRFTATSLRALFNGGAYAGGKPAPAIVPGLPPKFPYNFPNARVERIAVYTNTIPGGHVRAPGDIQFAFAFESHVDMIAKELRIDPLEFRLRNAIAGDESDVDGVVYKEPAAVAVLETLRVEGRYDEHLPPGRGRGISLCVRHIGGGKTSVVLELQRDGRVEVQSGAVEQGTGVQTVMQRVVAETLGIEPQFVTVARWGTDRIAFDPGAGGSRLTHVDGRAAIAAAEQLRTALEQAGWPQRPWNEVVAEALRAGPVRVVGTYEHQHSHDPEWSNFSGYLVDVSVDGETGALTIHDVILVADVGTIINPVAHRGQLTGGFVFGLGHALTEELHLEDGKITNLSLGEYKLPTQMDVPPFRMIALQQTGGPGPFGAKMAGELSTAGVAPALANAIAAACGARVTALPLTAERIYAALT